MEETLQQEKQELEYKHLNEEQGGIRRRLRDRDLLRKRKAEAEAKETNEMESQRKRPRAESGTKRRGRPKKSEPEKSVTQEEEEAGPRDAPAVAEVPVPAEAIPDQTPSVLDVESKPSSALASPAALPVFGSIQKPIFVPTLTPPAPVIPTPALFSPTAPSPNKVLDTAPIPVQDSAPALEDVPFPVPVLIQAPFSVSAAAPPAAPPQVETLFTESQGKEGHEQVWIEDLGPEEEADSSPSPNKRADDDLIETPSIDVPEQNEMFSIPTLSSTPPPQKYFSGNSF
ncbi:skin secretory protein xP2 isoform X2 [Cottoperca gobio]|uniref:Skin secretory protein xP2 isoform X2 n=1 Tax=Cottoperca gobio TaxID=56716 RepID=A0A6J2Q5R7_COTGO|nr:skin secretory protein xP2-like isoform X2 [Cottoperca gobio]